MYLFLRYWWRTFLPAPLHLMYILQTLISLLNMEILDVHLYLNICKHFKIHQSIILNIDLHFAVVYVYLIKLIYFINFQIAIRKISILQVFVTIPNSNLFSIRVQRIIILIKTHCSENFSQSLNYVKKFVTIRHKRY